jgi:hypothetical protein
MIMAAVQNGWLDHERAMLESLVAFKRAGRRWCAELLCADGGGKTQAFRLSRRLRACTFSNL